jgi:hypothetical protein
VPQFNPAVLAAFQQNMAKMAASQIDPAILARLGETLANIPMPQLDSAMLASLSESIAPNVARILAESGTAEAMREIAGRALVNVATTNSSREHRDAARIRKKPATKRAHADARKIV